MDPTPVGIMGCGAISDAYFEAGEAFDAFEITACADLDTSIAEEKATEYDVSWSGEPAAMLAETAVDVVVNLTPPRAHAEVATDILEAGKHLYTEKPLTASTDEARRMLETADDHQRRIGSAPDTFLGRGLQTARQAIDDGLIGEPFSATAFWTSGGHESWHPNPDIFYQPGGGPLFDMGPYYVTALTHLLGPIDRIAGGTQRPREERTITSEPRGGESIAVSVPTTEAGVVDFESGATATLLFSFDIPDSEIAPQNGFEIHGTDGTLRCPDPNHFDEPVEVKTGDSDAWETVPAPEPTVPQQRGLGLLDLVRAIDGEWTHRSSGQLAYHVLEALEGVRTASEESAYVTPSERIDRPPAIPEWY